jgi:hypothetical protein
MRFRGEDTPDRVNGAIIAPEPAMKIDGWRYHRHLLTGRGPGHIREAEHLGTGVGFSFHAHQARHEERVHLVLQGQDMSVKHLYRQAALVLRLTYPGCQDRPGRLARLDYLRS